MAVKKQPESGTDELSEAAHDWFRQFLKDLELFMVETGLGLRPDSESADYRLAAMRAVKLTLLDSGMDDEEIRGLFGRIAIEDVSTATQIEWSAELNKRRFDLIDEFSVDSVCSCFIYFGEPIRSIILHRPPRP
jgi:hypothetical protein